MEVWRQKQIPVTCYRVFESFQEDVCDRTETNKHQKPIKPASLVDRELKIIFYAFLNLKLQWLKQTQALHQKIKAVVQNIEITKQYSSRSTKEFLFSQESWAQDK